MIAGDSIIHVPGVAHALWIARAKFVRCTRWKALNVFLKIISECLNLGARQRHCIRANHITQNFTPIFNLLISQDSSHTGIHHPNGTLYSVPSETPRRWRYSRAACSVLAMDQWISSQRVKPKARNCLIVYMLFRQVLILH
jgi:hypothetical protein